MMSRGRQPYPVQPGTRYSLGLKVTAAVKGKIDAAAKASGRTQSQEAERLIELGLIFETLIAGFLPHCGRNPGAKLGFPRTETAKPGAPKGPKVAESNG